MVGEEVIAFGTNPKGKGGKKGLKAFFSDVKVHGVDDVLGVGAGVLVADLGVGKLTAPGEDGKSKIEPLSYLDLGVTALASIISGYIGNNFKGPRFGVAAMHGGMAILWQKALASGKEEPIGNKISAGYGSRLKAVFSGTKDDLLFLSGGMGDTYDEEGKLNGDEGVAVVSE